MTLDNLTVIIPYYNGAPFLPKLLRTMPAGLDVLVVNDASPDGRPNIDHAGIEVVDMPARGYWAGACNYGASLRPGRDLLFLNQDIVFTNSGWLKRLAAIAESGIDITGNWVRGHQCWPEGYVDGVFMFVKRIAWEAVGGMDAMHYPMWGSSCLLQAQICRNGGKAAPFADLSRYLVHRREGNLGNSFRGMLREEVGHLDNDGNIYRRVPPYVSVVIPGHGDYEQFLPDAVESIFRQTRADWQMVITLDGTASPALRAMAAEYADPWKGIFYVQQPAGRQGPPAVRNAGIQATRTRHYILMLDADDYAEPQAIDDMVRLAETNPHHLVYGNLNFVGDRTGVRNFPDYNYEQLLEANYIPSFILYPVAMWKAVGGYNQDFERGWDDYAFAIAAGRLGWCGVHLPEVVFNYRRHGRSRNHDSQDRREELRTLLRRNYPDVLDRRFPNMCCGSRNRTNKNAGTPRKAARITRLPAGVGEKGMVEVAYLGALGTLTVVGKATGARYRIHKGWKGYIDARDARIMVEKSREFEYTGRVAGNSPPPEKLKAQRPVKPTRPAPKPAPVPVAPVEPDPEPEPVLTSTVDEAPPPESEPEPVKPKRKYTRKQVEKK